MLWQLYADGEGAGTGHFLMVSGHGYVCCRYLWFQIVPWMAFTVESEFLREGEKVWPRHQKKRNRDPVL